MAIIKENIDMEQPYGATTERSLFITEVDDRRTVNAGRSPGLVRRLRCSLLATGLLFAACACIVTLSVRGPSPTLSKESSTEVITLDAIGTVGHAAGTASRLGSNLVEGLGETNTLVKDLHNDVNSSLPHIQGLLDSVRNAKLWLAKRGANLKGKLGHQFAMMRGQNITLPNITGMKELPVIPGNDMADGNSCADDEEMLGKLCYKKCSLLTDGDFPKRTTAFSCCKKSPCLLFNQKLSLKICGGFDVSGDSQGGGCPHPAGSCLGNEELHGNLCFKKCRLLTNFTYPYRMAAATCCKVKNLAACLNPKLSNTTGAYNVGGGGTGNLTSLSKPHPPMTIFTEGTASSDLGSSSSMSASTGSDIAREDSVREATAEAVETLAEADTEITTLTKSAAKSLDAKLDAVTNTALTDADMTDTDVTGTDVTGTDVTATKSKTKNATTGKATTMAPTPPKSIASFTGVSTTELVTTTMLLAVR